MATTKTKWSEWQSINLSGKHGGQICTPVVEGRRAGNKVQVRWHWDDASIARGQTGREYGHGEASGDYWTCIKALQADGIHIDDSRF